MSIILYTTDIDICHGILALLGNFSNLHLSVYTAYAHEKVTTFLYLLILHPFDFTIKYFNHFLRNNFRVIKAKHVGVNPASDTANTRRPVKL